MELDDDNIKRVETLCDKAISEIGEHVDTITIIVTVSNAGRATDGGILSTMRKFGSGSYYAQYGAAKEWVTRQEHEMANPVHPDEPEF